MKRALILALITMKIYASNDAAAYFTVANKVIESQGLVVCDQNNGPCWRLKRPLEKYLKSAKMCMSIYQDTDDQAYKNCIRGCANTLKDAVALAAARAKK